MSAARRLPRVSIDDYLAGEQISPVKHEYVGGVPYAMAGGSIRNHRIAGNIFLAAGKRLEGKPCQPYNSDLKVRVHLANEVRFYYPDLSIVCDPNPDDDTFVDNPNVLFEVLSKTTRRIDEGEKKDAYITIPSLNAYVLVEPDLASIVVWRRARSGFVRETLDGLDTVLRLPEIGIELPLTEIYKGVDFEAGG